MCGEKAASRAMPSKGQWITPACAGKSQPYCNWKANAQDHPRVCGEKKRPTPAASSRKGSPPRMRGKDGFTQTPANNDGITPAYAGKSSSRGVRTCFEKDHPRVCGEKRSQSTSASRRAGSPPRMRGKGRDPLESAVFHWITPAYAGKRCAMVF